MTDHHTQGTGGIGPPPFADPIRSIEYMLGQIKGQLDSALHRMESHNNDIDELRKRVTLLERWQSKALGIVLAASLLVSLASQYIKDYLPLK